MNKYFSRHIFVKYQKVFRKCDTLCIKEHINLFQPSEFIIAFISRYQKVTKNNFHIFYSALYFYIEKHDVKSDQLNEIRTAWMLMQKKKKNLKQD